MSATNVNPAQRKRNFAVQPALETSAERNQNSAVKPVVFFSSNLPWSHQQTPEGIKILREWILDAIDYGAQVINVAGLGYSDIATFNGKFLDHQMKTLEHEVREFLRAELLPHARERWEDTVAQPACRMVCNATCATFYLQSFADPVEYRTIDPDKSRPALGLTFHRQGHKLCVFTVCWHKTPRLSKKRMLQEYVKSAQEACSAEQPHFLIGGSFDLGMALMDRLLLDLPVPVDILVNDAPGTDYTAAKNFALVGGGLKCSSGGRPSTRDVIDVRVLIQEHSKPSKAQAPEPPPKKERPSVPPNNNSAVQPVQRPSHTI